MIGTEDALRREISSIALSFVGAKMGDDKHKFIVDGYNKLSGKPRGWTLKYDDSYCMAAVSMFAIWAGVGDIFPIECGTQDAVEIAQKMGIWVENDAYIAKPGDAIIYAKESEESDNKGKPYHVVLVYAVDNAREIFHCVSPNDSNHEVRAIDMAFDGKKIRGFITPKYSKSASCYELPKTGIVTETCDLYTGVPAMAAVCNVDANDGHGVRHVALKGEEVKILGERNGFYKVEYTGSKYTWQPWVDGKHLTVLK